MQNLTKLPSKAWVSLLWSQYNKLSEPLKEGFITMAYSMSVETGNRDTNAEIHKLPESVSLVKKVSGAAKENS
jgi:hypothetical protein